MISTKTPTQIAHDLFVRAEIRRKATCRGEDDRLAAQLEEAGSLINYQIAKLDAADIEARYLASLGNELYPYFKSGNDIPIERATIPAELANRIIKSLTKI